MRVDGGYIEANWIDGGGLVDLPNAYDQVKNMEFTESYNNYSVRDLPVHFFCDNDYQVIGMTLDGKIVMDTLMKYGRKDDITRRMNELGDHGYCNDFLETVKENYRKLQLPEVPKGILKIPMSI
jgi:hypothetical protein